MASFKEANVDIIEVGKKRKAGGGGGGEGGKICIADSKRRLRT